jgi:hypothetical protein
MSVDWPTARGSKGKGSTERRNAEKLVKSTSMTAVLKESAGFYSGFSHEEHYSGDDKTGIIATPIDDLSLTERHSGITFKGTDLGNLLIPGNPFAYPADFKVEDQRTKKITRPDQEFETPRLRRR